jgi:trigger factor
MRATSEVLDDNKVRIAVEVDEDEVEAAVANTAKAFAREARIPGFRPGKAPRQVVEARIGGSKALRGEALRDLLPDYYARAISATEVEPISSPELNVTSGEEAGPVEFDAVVEVRPTVRITGYGALRVAIPSPIVTDAEVDAYLDRLRETDAMLADVARPIVTGDHVTMDVRGRNAEGNEVVSIDDIDYVVGAGTLVDAADDQLPGMRAGETLEVVGTAPGGAQMSFTLTLKDVREQVLPELTDEWVAENSEFETAQELRDSYLERIRQAKLTQARASMRDATLGELATQVADDEVPESLLDSETRERLQEFQRRLETNGVKFETYFSATSQTPDQLVEMIQHDARQGVKVDLALRSIAAEEGLDPTPEQLDEELATLAERVGRTPEKLREELDRAGRMGALRAEKAKDQAIEWVLERVTYVDEAGAEIDRSILEAAEVDSDAASEDEDEPTATDTNEESE